MIRAGSGWRSHAASVGIIVGFVILSSAVYFQGIAVGAATTPNIVAQSVTGSINTSNTGHEAFWSQIPGTEIPLTSSNDYGGAIKSVTIKMANNGTHILVYATWADPTQSRTKNNVIEDEKYPGLFYANSSFYYEDRIVFWWSLNQNPGPPPCMAKAAEGHGEGEALAGTGNLWHWKGARTDSLGASYGKLKFGSGPNTGQLITPPHSFADNEFINTTGHYQLGWDQYPTATAPGNFTVGFGENSIPYNTFLVYAHGVYDPTSHAYTWEAARSLHTTPTLHTIQFSPSTTYYFAVAVFDGGPISISSSVPHPAGWNSYGENEETKSISTWYTMALAPSAAAAGTVTQTVTNTQTTTQTAVAAQPGGAITPETALFTGVATLIIGLAAGIIAGSGRLVRSRG